MSIWAAALKTAREWVANSIPAQVAVAIASAALLFGPDKIISAMGLRQIRDDYSQWFGVALLVVGSLLCAEGVTAFGAWARQRVVWRVNLRRLKQRLRALTPAEREALRRYVYEDNRTQYFDIQDGVAQGLVHAKIIYRASNLGSTMGGFAYNVQPWAWEYLQAHRDLLD
jgi:hypothetical protein